MPIDLSNPGLDRPTLQHSRREFLRQGSRGLFGAAACGISALTSGCVRRAAKQVPIRVGILHSQTGTMAISETSLRDIELFAIEEINAAGGILGRRIEPIVEDPKSRFSDLFPRRARKLLAEESVVAVFGCWTSASRKAVLPVFEELDRLLFYPVQYEGNECSPNVIYTGSLPNQQILPAIDWLRSLSGGARRRLFLLGSDYVFPWTLSHVIETHLAATYPDTEVVGKVYVPLGERAYEQVVRQIIASDADAVINMINGDSNIYFYNELKHQNISPDDLPVMATSIGEDELRGLLPEAVEGHLVAANYFQSVNWPANRRFVEGFQREHGEDRVIGDPMEAAYVAVHLWKEAVERAGSTETARVREALGTKLSIDAPGGKVSLDPRNQHLTKRCRVGRIRPDLQFDIVYEAPRVLSPDPFPQEAFPGWRCDWTEYGLVEGEPVSIRPKPPQISTS